MDRLTRGALALSIGGGMAFLLTACIFRQGSLLLLSAAIPVTVWLAYYLGAWVWTGRRAEYVLSGIPLAVVVFPTLFAVGALTIEDAVEKYLRISLSGGEGFFLLIGAALAGAALVSVLAGALFPARRTEEDRG